MAGEKKPPASGRQGFHEGSDDGSVEIEALFEDLFDEAPPTDPTVPTLPEFDEEVTLEVPATAAAAGINPRARVESEVEVESDVEPEAPAFFAPILPEMEAEIWQAGIQALVTVPERADPPATSRDDWMEEARLFQTESNSAETPVLAAGLLTAAARAAEVAGEAAEAASGYDEALARAPTAPDALRARARLAESIGDIDEAHALWARLTISAGSAEERAFYGALSAEWTLARRGALPAVAVDAIPAGAARALAVVEEALRGGPPVAAAAAFAAAGRVLGGRFGAAFLDQAARFSVVASDAASAAVYRTAARKLDPHRNPTSGESLLDGLREAAWTERRGGGNKNAKVGTTSKTGEPADLEQILAALPAGSALAQAVGRWAAAGARRRGDPAGALALLTGLGATTAAAARDRLDLEVLAQVALDDRSLARLRESATAPAAAANLIWIEAGELVRRGEHQAAAGLLARGIEEHADAVPLALLAQEIAASTDDLPLEAATLDLWLRGDPARRAEAALALAATLEATGSGLNARAALQTAVESAPESASFWIAAASDARAGRRSDAAAALGFGAEVWESSSLVPGLRAAAAVKFGPSDPARALVALGFAADGALSDAALALGASAVARLAERAGDRAAFEAALDAAEAVTRDPAQAAWLALQRALSIPSAASEPGDEADGEARVRALERALAVAPRHPLALGLYLAEPGVDLSAAAAALSRVGAASPEISAFSRTMVLAAASTLALSGDREGALRCAAEILAAAPADPEARSAVARMAAALGSEGGLRALAGLALAPAGRDEALSLAVTEARIAVGSPEAAGEALRIVGGGRFGADARRAGAKIVATDALGVAPFPRGLFPEQPDQAAGESRAALATIVDAASAGRWDELVAALASAPPHEGAATAGTLALGSLVAEGHGDEAAADRLAEAAVRADGGAPSSTLTLARVVDSAADTAVRSRALTAATARRGAAESDRRSAAAALAERARLEEAAGDPAAAAESWRASLAAEPTFLPAARALRIVAARTGDSAATSGASETEAACLQVPAHRVRALLLSAALAVESSPPQRERSLGLLRAALAIDPAHDAAFERLRALLTDLNDAPALAAALAARIEVAVNPFEVTSLRLTRADVLAGTLGDWGGAREELEAVLRRQPEHARALERLSELLWTREAWGEAGEIYLRRAVVERDPATLRGIFLRLGEIYSSRVPDPKRAAAAYERVLGVDADNLEALRALSDLTVAEGDTKRALPITDRLVAREPDVARRHKTRIRLGEILMQTGDLRRSGVELRRVVDESPRDLAAVGALAQLLDRARDQAGRRTVLDRAVRLHRQDLAGPGGVQQETLRALAMLMSTRERSHAALAAAQLVAAVGGGMKEGVREASRPGRSLAALRRPEVDDRVFSSEALPTGIRQLLRQLGPLLRPSGQELAQRLGRQGVGKADRRARGTPPRPLFDAVAAELGVGDFDLYVKAGSASAGPIPLRAEPGSPPAIIIGAQIEELGPAAQRFAAARVLRLTSTNLDAILAGSPEEAGALLVGIIRQFVPDYEQAEVPENLIALEMARAERAIPRKLKPQVMPFAVESAGAFDLGALYAATRDAANVVGLLAAGDLPAALSVILEVSGRRAARPGGGRGLTLEAVGANPEAMALLQFAVSDEFDDLARALES